MSDSDDSRAVKRRRSTSKPKYVDEKESNSESNNDSDSENNSRHRKKSMKLQKSTKPRKKAEVTKKSKPKKVENSDEESQSDDSNNSANESEDNNSEESNGSEEETERETMRKVTQKKTSINVKSNKGPKRSGNSLKLSERLEEARKAYKWWEAPELPGGMFWRKLEHRGVLFAPPYVRHNVPFFYDGKHVELTDEQEEIVSFFAAIPHDGPQLGNPKTKEVFQANFFKEFKESLPSGHVIKSFNKCDFSRIKEHLELQRSLKKAATEEEKLNNKNLKSEIQLKHGYALIDGRMEKMGNYNMEPPGLFRGRGEHPRTGALKKRCYSEAVSVNISVNSAVPQCDLAGHAWANVQHDPMVTWLCSWKENVQDQQKYVMLAASSSFKGKSDLEKYDKAIRLKKHIAKIRQDYTEKIKSKDKSSRQVGTAMWVIDVLALRVGGEKGEEEADTVGCCSLRVEHVTFNPEEGTYEIDLEFLGKDSMLYKQTINFGLHGDLGKLVYRNLKGFCAGKGEGDDIFDTLTPTILNKHLNSLMPGLSAKVFRTFNASVTLEKELPTAESMSSLSVQEKMALYNSANRQVAILCNHQKTVSKATEIMFENLNEKLEVLKSQRRDMIKWKEYIKAGKEGKIPLRKNDSDVVDEIVNQVKAAIARKDSAKTPDEKIAAAAALEEAKLRQKQDQKRRHQEKHLYTSTPTKSNLENKIEKWNEDIHKMETDIRNRDENKEVALGTSKINYMDPRISVAWCKRCEVPIDKVFAKTLREKFNWAMAVPPDWKFDSKSLS